MKLTNPQKGFMNAMACYTNNITVSPSDTYVSLNDILYKTNSSEIDPASKLVLQGFAQWLKENPTITIEIQGHTDDLGSDADNLALSQDRAFSVMTFLAAQGIPASRIKFKGYGETKPKFPNTSDDNRRENRRTDFLIL
jgi:outer membrane protein OmpA-like peptidoglycan-associated protein